MSRYSTLNTYTRLAKVSKKKLAQAPDDRRVLAACRKRAHGRCECDGFCPDCPGYGEHLHHKRKTAQGGKTTMENCLYMADVCNGFIEHKSELAAKVGLTIRRDGKWLNYPNYVVDVLPATCPGCGNRPVWERVGRYYDCGCAIWKLAIVPGEGQ